jgi:hypothetical protein
LLVSLLTLPPLILGAALAQPRERERLEYLGQSANGKFSFENVAVSPASLKDASWVHYARNPIISGSNLYAPSVIDNDGVWFVYVGGWRDSRDHNDRVYLTTTRDPNLIGGYGPLSLVVDNGHYVHVNDPSVVRRSPRFWAMALTVNRSVDWIALLTSRDGVHWSPNTFADRGQEVRFTGGRVAKAGRPSLLYDPSRGRWELYFDGKVDGVDGQFLAYSQEPVPRTFAIQGRIGPWYDAEIKKVGSRYLAAFRKIEAQRWPWRLWGAESSDGRRFTETGLLLEPDPLVSYDAAGVTNPGFAVDREGRLRALLFGGTSVQTLTDHKIGIAFPQQAVELRSGNVWHVHRQALDPATQTIETHGHPTIDWIRITDAGRVEFDQGVRPYALGATFRVSN